MQEQDSASNTSIVARLMSELHGKSDHAKVSSSNLCATGEGLPALPKKCVDKILAGEFVDFADLPPAKGRVKASTHAIEGQVVVVHTADLLENRKLIPDLATWVQCFGVYSAIIISKEPEWAKNLLAYMALIAKCSQWPSWIVYDLNFLQEAAESGQKDWSKVEPSIYTQCFTGAAINQESWCRSCHSIDHASDMCPIKPGGLLRRRKSPQMAALPPVKKQPPSQSSPQICRKFNMFNGDCRFRSACIFQHKCENCGEQGHPATKCQKPKKENSG